MRLVDIKLAFASLLLALVLVVMEALQSLLLFVVLL